ncbi:MAG TPA: carbohydrate kinase family protein [Streptosporangiaceae bacterium]|nr:carbohydrate kinase family protein [Streptosporangiaceae bacterium]
MADFWVVGPIAWDRVLHVPCLPPSGGFVQASDASERPGGSGANAAIALASTGATVHMVGYIGEDEPGERLRAVLGAAEVDVGFVHVRDGHTSEVVILLEPSGERAMTGMWPDLLHTVPVPVADITAGDVVYFAGWREEFLPAMTKLTAAGVIVASVPPPLLASALQATYVIGSETQYGDQNLQDIVSTVGGPLRAVVATRGPDGVVIHDYDGSTAYPAQQVGVVDTTGAGDAFAAGFLRQIAGGGTIGEAAAAGIAWASAAVQSPASIPPPWGLVRDAGGDALPKWQ